MRNISEYYTGKTIKRDGVDYYVLDSAKLDFAESIIGSRSRQPVKTAEEGYVTYRRVNGRYTTYTCKGGEAIFVSSTGKECVPCDANGQPNGWRLLNHSHHIGQSESGELYCSYSNLHRHLLIEAIQRPTVIMDAYGPGKHEFMQPGTTLEKTPDGVRGIERRVLDTRWRICGEAGAQRAELLKAANRASSDFSIA